MKVKTKVALIYLLTLVGIIIWLSAIFYASYLRNRSSPFSGLLYAVFAPTCHQIPSRCFYAFGNPVAVCARCLGIYAGFFLGTLLYPMARGLSPSAVPKAKTFLLLSAPIVADTAGNMLGLWMSVHWLRLVTGVVWGSILPFYFLAGLTDLILRSKQKKPSDQPADLS